MDQSIAVMANQRLGDVVMLSEGLRPKVGFPHGSKNAAQLLVARMFTDAIFSQDIRAIQLIINRIDGGLPKDTEVDDYQTLFGDCLSQVMHMDNGNQLKWSPDDSVMMAMCKSLYDMAVEDIYWDYEKKRRKRPTEAQKKERDAALRMVLERTGGRKTLSANVQEAEEIEIAPWIAQLQEST